jgi:hypothetical protein
MATNGQVESLFYFNFLNTRNRKCSYVSLWFYMKSSNKIGYRASHRIEFIALIIGLPQLLYLTEHIFNCFAIHLLNHMVVVGFKSYLIFKRWCAVLTISTNKLGDCSGSQKLDRSFIFRETNLTFIEYIKLDLWATWTYNTKFIRKTTYAFYKDIPRCKCFSTLFVVIVHG